MEKCPYDGFDCEKQTERINSWVRAVEYMAENRVNHLFITSDSMFDNCDYKHQCIRYLDFVRKTNQKSK